MKDGKGRSVTIFHLKRFWKGDADKEYDGTVDLYEEIKSGRKKSEYRDATPYWAKRLLKTKRDLKESIPNRAWFVVGYPRGNLPRLEADMRDIIVLHVDTGQYEICVENVVEVKD